MKQLLKLLYTTNFATRYVNYIIFFISFYLLLNLCLLHFSINFKTLNGYNSKLYTDNKIILVWNKYYLIVNDTANVFPSLQCTVNNCIFTTEKDLLNDDISRFDAIIFDEGELLTDHNRPRKRASSQIYVFTTIESAYNRPACEIFNDDFFNWTFTYKLDSDIIWRYFVVQNATGHVVAPNKIVVWETNNSSIDPRIRTILRHKKKAAAWLVSHCMADSLRDEYLTRLQEHLFHYSLQIDAYGSCSGKKCTYNNCEDMLTNDYYFYMAFENSFSDDYVTEKVLHGYDNYVVPIVYGGANYSRFLPPNSYINAREVHPYNLASMIYRAIKDPEVYESYFRWRNIYTINAYAPGIHPLCHFCEALNEVEIAPVHKQFRLWWNGPSGMKWCLPVEYWNEVFSLSLDTRHIFTTY